MSRSSLEVWLGWLDWRIACVAGLLLLSLLFPSVRAAVSRLVGAAAGWFRRTPE